MEKTTLKEQLNAITFGTLTEEQFNFVMERALKSVKANTNHKPSKKQLENADMRAKLVGYLKGQNVPTAKKEVAEYFGITETKVSSLLTGVEGLERTVKKVGKKETTYYGF